VKVCYLKEFPIGMCIFFSSLVQETNFLLYAFTCFSDGDEKGHRQVGIVVGNEEQGHRG